MIKELEEELVAEASATSNKAIVNPYSEELAKLNNPFADKDVNFFLQNHTERIKTYTKDNLKSLAEFLLVLANAETGTVYDYKELQPGIKINSLNSIVTSIGNTNFWIHYKATYGRSPFMGFNKNILPFCCGVSEFGSFNFAEIKKIDTNLVYNIFIDYIRLIANTYRDNKAGTGSGAFSIINFFIDTPFTNVLSKRDDITFIKEFTNPKTRARLRSFIFDTKI